MKIAYRIITPMLSVGAIVMGILFKLFYFALGVADESLGNIVTIAEALGVKTKYEFSVIDIIRLLADMDTTASEDGLTVAEVAAPIIPHLISFVIFFLLTILMFLAVGIVAAATNKRNLVIGLCGGGIVLSMVCIVIARLAFDKILGGEIVLSDLMSIMSENVGMQLLAVMVTISNATLSSGFYAVFGMYLLVIFWTIIANMIIKTPIQVTKKHKRKKPVKNLSAIIHR